MKRRFFAACFIAAAAGTTLFAGPAHAASTKVVPTLCYTIGGSGDRVYLPDATSTVTTDTPLEVLPGQKFTVNINVLTKPADLPVDVFTKNITITFDVTGGATPATFQGAVSSALAIPGEVFHFGPFSQEFTAPATPGPLSIKIRDVHIDEVHLGENPILDVSCEGPEGFDLTLAHLDVVAPPAPEAPDAIADEAAVNAGASVTVDVIANDKASTVGPIDPATLTIAAQGTKGTASVVDGKLVYAASAGASGVDTLRYRVCTKATALTTTTTTSSSSTTTSTTTTVAPSTTVDSQVDSFATQAVDPTAINATAIDACDEASVTVSVAGAVAAAATPTTHAAEPAAAALPVTGSTSSGTAALGGFALVAGTALVAFARHRRTA